MGIAISLIGEQSGANRVLRKAENLPEDGEIASRRIVRVERRKKRDVKTISPSSSRVVAWLLKEEQPVSEWVGIANLVRLIE